MVKKKFTPELDVKKAAYIAETIISMFDGMPMEHTKTCLNGLFVALIAYARLVKKYESEKGMIEKLIMSWFESADNAGGFEFSKYINLPKQEEE